MCPTFASRIVAVAAGHCHVARLRPEVLCIRFQRRLCLRPIEHALSDGVAWRTASLAHHVVHGKVLREAGLLVLVELGELRSVVITLSALNAFLFCGHEAHFFLLLRRGFGLGIVALRDVTVIQPIHRHDESASRYLIFPFI